MGKEKIRWLVGLCICGTPVAVNAQVSEVSDTPAQRERGLQTGQGIRSGSFTFIPALSASMTYDDNIYATDIDRVDDFIADITPSLAIRSDLADKSLNAYLYYTRTLYVDAVSQNTSQYGANVEGSYSLSDGTSLSTSLRADRAVESRRSLGSYRQSDRPVQYTDLEAKVSASHNAGPLYLGTSGRVRRVGYGAADLNGNALSQKDRNFTIYGGDVIAGYNLHRLTRLIATFTAERRQYDVRIGRSGFDPTVHIDRGAEGFRIEGGVQRELSALLSGTIRIGYMKFNYADSRLRDVSSFSYFGDLRWSFTPLTTIKLSASRRLDETVSPLTAGNLRDEAALSVSHELLRTLFIEGSLRAAAIRPTGNQQDSNEFEGSLAARYYFGRRFRLELAYTHASRNSDDRSIAFRDNTVLLSLRVVP